MSSHANDPSLQIVQATAAEVRRMVTPRLKNKRALLLLRELIDEMPVTFFEVTFSEMKEHHVRRLAVLLLKDEITRKNVGTYNAYVVENFGFFDRFWNWRMIREDRKALVDFSQTIQSLLDTHHIH